MSGALSLHEVFCLYCFAVILLHLSVICRLIDTAQREYPGNIELRGQIAEILTETLQPGFQGTTVLIPQE